jgi:hypothetical protein
MTCVNLRHLSAELEREVLSYLLPNPAALVFRAQKVRRWGDDHASAKYEHAYLGTGRVTNPAGDLYLSRISKKNGKHRYYLSLEIREVIDVDEGGDIYMYEYRSEYVGKNVEQALWKLLYG